MGNKNIYIIYLIYKGKKANIWGINKNKNIHFYVFPTSGWGEWGVGDNDGSKTLISIPYNKILTFELCKDFIYLQNQLHLKCKLYSEQK